MYVTDCYSLSAAISVIHSVACLLKLASLIFLQQWTRIPWTNVASISIQYIYTTSSVILIYIYLSVSHSRGINMWNRPNWGSAPFWWECMWYVAISSGNQPSKAQQMRRKYSQHSTIMVLNPFVHIYLRPSCLGNVYSRTCTHMLSSALRCFLHTN